MEYAFRAIPLGGFVGFPDDDPDLKDKFPPDDPNLLKNRPIKDRALVISAGIIANCIFAMSILLTQVGTRVTGAAPVMLACACCCMSCISQETAHASPS